MSAVGITNNLVALKVQRGLTRSSQIVASATERLSSGLRITRPSDDAASAAIAQGLTVDSRVYGQAVRNVNDGQSAANVADGALDEMSNIVGRIKELATQAANGVNSNTQRASLQQEATALRTEYNRIINSTTFNGKHILAEDNSIAIQAGYGTNNSVTLTVGSQTVVPAGVENQVSLTSAGTQGNDESYSPSLSVDGRYVTFVSFATNLVGGDTNGVEDIFVRDQETGITSRISVSSSGTEGNGLSKAPSISADGRYVAFRSSATNLVPSDTNGAQDIFVHDRATGTTTRVSVDSAGTQANGASTAPKISADGRYVTFVSAASNLVAGDTNGVSDVFVHDLQTGLTTRESLSTAGVAGNAASSEPSLSGDGRYVTFASSATNLVAGDLNTVDDVFIRDRQTGTTTRVSLSSGGLEGDGASESPSVTDDGRYVLYTSLSTNLVSGDTNGVYDVFLRDLATNQTTAISVTSSGTTGNGHSLRPAMSATGQYIAFESDASNIVAGDSNGTRDIFVYDRTSGQMSIMSRTSAGVQGNGFSQNATVSGTGKYIAFNSLSTNLSAGDTNGTYDVFFGFTRQQTTGVQAMEDLNISSQYSAAITVDLVEVYADDISTARAAVGSTTSRLDHVGANLATVREATLAAASQLTDADVAEESSRLVRGSILQTTGAKLLAQVSQQPALLLDLLA